MNKFKEYTFLFSYFFFVVFGISSKFFDLKIFKFTYMAKWNEELNDWVIKPPKKFQKKKGGNRPVSAVGMKRPTSEYSRIAKGLGDVNPRFKIENILDLDLDMPERTTEDYQGQASERVHNAISMILNQNEEEQQNTSLADKINFNDSILTEAQAKPKSDRPKSAKRVKTAKKKKALEEIPDEEAEKKVAEEKPVEMFPKARGLK